MTGTQNLPPAPATRFRLPSVPGGALTEEQREILLAHTRTAFSTPTAPYAEDGQVELIRRFAESHDGLRLEEDEYANQLLYWDGKRSSGRKRKGSLPAFSAHLDHPGFAYMGKRDGRHRARFLGGLPEKFFPKQPVRFYDLATREELATANVARTTRNKQGELLVDFSHFRGTAKRGMFGMWDLTPGYVRGRRLHGRVCDDLVGVVSILALMEILHATAAPEPALGIFTRAEETGFMGCLGLLRAEELRENVAVIGLEASSERPSAKLGGGPVIRVGDRSSIFEPWITRHLEAAGASLAKEHEGFQVQRALMDGGRCESTAYNLYGVPAGALCVALGNYHNHSKSGGVAAECVDWGDLEGMLALMLRTTLDWQKESGGTEMMASLDRIWEQEGARLERSAARIKHSKAGR